MAGPEDLVAALTSLSVDAASPGDEVTATVNTDGVLTGLKLSAAVRGLPPDELAALILRTCAAAQRDSALRTAALLAPVGMAGYVMDRLRWRAGFTPEEAPAEPAPPRRVPPRRTGSAAAPSHSRLADPAPSRPAASPEARAVTPPRTAAPSQSPPAGTPGTPATAGNPPRAVPGPRPSGTPPVASQPGVGSYLRDRTADPERPAGPDRPVSDEDWYGEGVRFDQAW